jgi:hypothetical protein
LLACIEANANFVTWVAFGIDPKSYSKVDRGRNRNVGQLIGMRGYTHGHSLGAASKFAYLYREGTISMSTLLRSIRAKTTDPTPEMLVDFIIGEPSFTDMTKHYTMYASFPPLDKSGAHALHWLMSQAHSIKCEEFMLKLCEGTDLTKGDPIWKLRNRLVQVRDRKERLPKAHKYAWVVKAFNAWMANTPLEVFKIGPIEKFPKIR